MINTVRLQNFQRHKDSTFELGPITVIEGVSDQGKSSFVRALYWLVFNRPIGADCFRKYNTKQVTVEVDIDGRSLARSRTEGGEHNYSFGDESFQGFNKEVPSPISDFLQLLPLNFCGQHDGAFLLSQPRPDASRYLASLVGLEQMDKAMQTVEHQRRSIASEINLRQEEITILQEELKKTQFVKEMSQECDSLVELEKSVNLLKSEVEELSSLIDDCISLEKQIRELQFVDEADARLLTLEVYDDEWKKLCIGISRLENLISEIEKIDKELRHEEAINRASDDLTIIDHERRAIMSLQGDINALQSLVDGIEGISFEEDVLKKLLWNDELVFKREMPEICPLCGAKVKK